MKLPDLDLAVVTYGPEGMERVAKMLPEPAEGVRYVVSWQASEAKPLPDLLRGRSDVEVHRIESKGISLNRNNALAHCTADIILFADDDLTLYPEGLTELRKAFAENPDVDVATFRSDHGDMSRFPTAKTILGTRLPKNYYVSGIEIALRRSSAGALCWCPELGLGVPRLHGGEDELFVLSAIRRGLKCCFFPITICAHPHPSTGTKRNPTPGNLRGAGCTIALTYPLSWPLRVPLKAWRLRRQGAKNILRSLYYLFCGAAMAPGVLRRNRDTLW